jgi:hypothetical protein
MANKFTRILSLKDPHALVDPVWLLTVTLILSAPKVIPQVSLDTLGTDAPVKSAQRFGIVLGGVYAENNQLSHFPILGSTSEHQGVQPFAGCWYASGHERTHILLEVVYERQQWKENYLAKPGTFDYLGYTSGELREGQLEKVIQMIRISQSLAFPLKNGWQVRPGFDVNIPIHVMSTDHTTKKVFTGYAYGHAQYATVDVTYADSGRQLVRNPQLALSLGFSKEFAFGWIIATSGSIGFTKWSTQQELPRMIPFFGRTSLSKTLFGTRKMPTC